MSNSDVKQAWAYHDRTKHSERSVRENMYGLDFSNQPLPFKIYESLEPIILPRETEQTGITALAAVSQQFEAGIGEAMPTLKDLARILYFSAGITKHKTYPGGEIFFRAASCTGALYEFELYVVCGGLPGLEAGLYHFGPADFSLRRLRAGDFRSVLVHASADEGSVAHAPLTIVWNDLPVLAGKRGRRRGRARRDGRDERRHGQCQTAAGPAPAVRSYRDRYGPRTNASSRSLASFGTSPSAPEIQVTKRPPREIDE